MLVFCLLAILCACFGMAHQASSTSMSAWPVLASLSPSGVNAVGLSAETDLQDGALILVVDGLTSHPGLAVLPWAVGSGGVVQWLDNGRYLLGGTVVVDAATGSTAPLPFEFMYTHLSSAVSPNRQVVAVAVRNYDRQTIQLWAVDAIDTSLSLLFETPLTPPYTELRMVLAWGSDDMLYFDLASGGTSRILRYAGNTVSLFLDDSACPCPSPDGKYLAYLRTDSEGRGLWQAVLDLQNHRVIQDGLPSGVVTWTAKPGVYSIHLGRQLAVFSTSREASVSAFELVTVAVSGQRITGTRLVEVSLDQIQ